MRNEKGTFTQTLQRLLLTYRTTPHSTTNFAPAALIFGKRLKTVMNIIKSNLA